MGPKNSKNSKLQDQKQKNQANQIIIGNSSPVDSQNFSVKGDKIVYLPVYISIVVKNFKEVKFEELNSQINCSLIVAIGVGGLPQALQKYLSKNIIIFLSRDGGLRLEQNKQNPEVTSNFSNKNNERYLTFTLRKTVNAKIEPYIFFTPFEIIDQIFTIQFRKLKVPTIKKKNEHNSLTIKFNLMETRYDHLKFKCYNNCAFGNYDIANNRFAIEYTSQNTPQTLMKLGKNIYSCGFLDQKREEYIKQEEEQKKKNQKDKYVQYCHFHIPLYRYPIVALSSQDPGLADRIASIATLMIAFVGLIPIIREQLPPNPKVTILEILIYCEIATTFLCLVESLQVRNLSQDEFGQEFKPYSSALYLISLIVTMCIVIIPIVSHIIHLIFLQPSHKSARYRTQTGSEQNYTEWNASTDAREWLEKAKNMTLKSQGQNFHKLIKQISENLDIKKMQKQ